MQRAAVYCNRCRSCLRIAVVHIDFTQQWKRTLLVLSVLLRFASRAHSRFIAAQTGVIFSDEVVCIIFSAPLLSFPFWAFLG